MNDFDKFIEIPSKEISDNTHILEEFIIYIKNKDYGKIKIRTHFHGFIYSISDEYGFDLKFLLEEYEKFHNPKLVIKEKLKKETEKQLPKSDSITINDNEKNENKLDGNNHFIIIGLIFSLVLILFWFIFKNDNEIDKKVLPIKQTNIEQKKEVVTLVKEENKAIDKEENKLIIKKKTKYTFDISKAKKLYKIKDNMFILEPFKDNKLWLGLRNLNSKKQIGSVIEGLISYKIKSNTIISTGHGYLNLIDENKDKPIQYRTFDKLFFYYKSGFLYQIKKEDVLALNGGIVW